MLGLDWIVVGNGDGDGSGNGDGKEKEMEMEMEAGHAKERRVSAVEPTWSDTQRERERVDGWIRSRWRPRQGHGKRGVANLSGFRPWPGLGEVPETVVETRVIETEDAAVAPFEGGLDVVDIRRTYYSHSRQSLHMHFNTNTNTITITRISIYSYMHIASTSSAPQSP